MGLLPSAHFTLRVDGAPSALAEALVAQVQPPIDGWRRRWLYCGREGIDRAFEGRVAEDGFAVRPLRTILGRKWSAPWCVGRWAAGEDGTAIEVVAHPSESTTGMLAFGGFASAFALFGAAVELLGQGALTEQGGTLLMLGLIGLPILALSAAHLDFRRRLRFARAALESALTTSC